MGRLGDSSFILHPSSFPMTPFLTIAQASATYPVYVGGDLLDRVGTLVQPRGRVFVLTSRGLRERFGMRVAASFSPSAAIIAVEEGEVHKTLATPESVVTSLLQGGAQSASIAV